MSGPEADPVIRAVAAASINRLAKWRSVFTGWQLGTRPRGDGESEAVRDHREVTMLMRVELNALARILIDANVMTADTWARVLGEEAEYLSTAYEAKFPGAKAVDDGIEIDTETFHATTKRMGFPQ